MLLENRKIIVTGGPTREWIDPVRFISNASSGKMGIALADAAAAYTPNTVFVHGPVDASLLKEKTYRQVAVESTGELMDAVLAELEPDCILIMAAAPADYRPVERADKKIKKKQSELVVALTQNPDILKRVAEYRRQNQNLSGMYVVGFAAETDNAETYALQKLKEKNLDMICLNDIGKKGAGFAGDTNIITVFTALGYREDIPLRSKAEIAHRILSMIKEKLARVE